MYYINKYLFIFFIILLSNNLNAFVLDEIKERGFLKCGVSEPRIGFASINDSADWIGFDVDMCRSISAAIFGDPNKVEFTTTSNKSRFPLLASGEIDVLSRITTWSFARDVNLGFEFTGINFYDGQAFMVRSSLNIESAKDLDGASICLILDTTSYYNINNFFSKNNISFIPVPVEFEDEALENFLVDRCDVYSNYLTELANQRLSLPNPSQYKILTELISKEPLSTVVRHGDDQWRDIVSWSLKVMIIAEELGINSKNIDEFLDSENNEILRLLGMVGAYGDMIELDEKWAYNIIKMVGNYEEVFEKNIGKKTILGLNRGLNNLYINGGLLYAPPFR